MSNTVIQLKYSSITSTPPSLNVGEPAYSFASDKLFIGNTTSGVLVIGGKYYTDIIEAATNLNTPSTLVERDSNGNFSANTITANIVGTVQSASKWSAPIDLGLSGDATGNVSFDGSSNVTLTVDLSDTGVSPGTYGGASNVPYFTVDSEGRITSAGNSSISTALSFAGDGPTTGSLNLLTDTLTIVGRDGITTTAVDSNNSVLVDVDNTVIRTTGGQTISGDLSITGNLYLTGNATYINVTSLKIEDSLIQLGANNEVSDVVDLGFYGHYSDDSGTSKRHTGLFRDASSADKRYILFTNLLDSDLDGDASTVNVAQTSFAIANLQANLVGGSISGLLSAVSVADGGTGNTSLTLNHVLLGSGTNPITTVGSSTEGHVLQINGSGVPVFGHLSGGTF